MENKNYSKENKMNTLPGFEKVEVRSRERMTGGETFITVSDKSVAIRFNESLANRMGIEKGMFAQLERSKENHTLFAIKFSGEKTDMRVCSDGGSGRGVCVFTKKGAQRLFKKLGKKIKVTKAEGLEHVFFLSKFED